MVDVDVNFQADFEFVVSGLAVKIPKMLQARSPHRSLNRRRCSFTSGGESKAFALSVKLS